MTVRMSGARFVDSVNERCRRLGYPAFAWWIPIVMDAFAIGAGIVAVLQRAEQGALLPAAMLAAIALSPWLQLFTGTRLPWWLFMAVTLSATGVLISRYPVDYDFAFFVWVMLVGHVGATEPLVRSLFATTIAIATLGVLVLVEPVAGAPLWLAALVVGGDIGVIMRYQQGRLDEEARLHREHEAAAVLQERQRIAREVHDVVAHSLSVTMLHLTAARRSLEQDGEAGIDEAIDALRDAEHLGREAMSDIRTTVGLLGQDTGVAAAAPDLRDLPALVDDFRQAGLDVFLDVRGDPATVPPNAGLSLYRIVQESLANVAKHEPGSHAEVVLECGPDQRLRVGNTRVLDSPRQDGGSGLKGMRERAELLGGSLTAGPVGEHWVVDVTLPGRARPGRGCPVGLRSSADQA